MPNQAEALSAHVQKNHLTSSIIGEIQSDVTTRKKKQLNYVKMILNICYTSPIEPTSVTNVLKMNFGFLPWKPSWSSLRETRYRNWFLYLLMLVLSTRSEYSRIKQMCIGQLQGLKLDLWLKVTFR